MTLFSSIFVRHTVDRLELEGQSIDLKKIEVIYKVGDTYEGNLFDDMDTVDILFTISSKRAVSHHGVLGTSVRVVD